MNFNTWGCRMRTSTVRLLALFLGFVWLPLVALSGTRDPNTPDADYVEFGKKFPAVQRLRATVKFKDEKSGIEITAHNYGSAVVIRPNWVLTAAHVLSLDNPTDPVILKDGTTHVLSHVVVHPDWQEEGFGFSDIALCYSEKDFALEFYPALYTDTDEDNKAITISGYGFHGTFHSGANTMDHKKRGGHNKIDRCERGVLICSPSVTQRMPLEFMIAPGDSGGGMFIGNKLAGINSFLMAIDKKPDGTYGDESAFTRVSLYSDWIESEIAKHVLKTQGKSTLASDVSDPGAIILPPSSTSD